MAPEGLVRQATSLARRVGSTAGCSSGRLLARNQPKLVSALFVHRCDAADGAWFPGGNVDDFRLPQEDCQDLGKCLS
eukprot:scaffold1954_cov268-Pinguiococcus_pyrenoidosus.AAC.136